MFFAIYFVITIVVIIQCYSTVLPFEKLECPFQRITLVWEYQIVAMYCGEWIVEMK